MSKLQSQKIQQLLPLVGAIKARCLDCSAGSLYEVKMYICPSCALFPYRMGLNSNEPKTTNKKSKLAVKTPNEAEIK